MGQYTETEVNQALNAVASGQSVRKAAHDAGIPPSTLQSRLKGSQARNVAFSSFQKLSPAQESHLAEWVRIQAALGLPPTHQQLKEFAQRILDIRGTTQPLGRNWIQFFIKRNPSIKVHRARAIDSKRVNGASTNVIRQWFQQLALPEIKAIKPHHRYNMDETGILEGRGSNGLVLGSSESSSMRKKQPGSRAWTTMLECVSATGQALPPLVIYRGKSVQQQWFPLDIHKRDIYSGWKFTATENGWTSDSTAVEWLENIFIPLTKPDHPSEQRLLILDGHGSHETTEFMYLCYKHKIYLLFLPPHTSHVLQPLDQAVFGPLKATYRKELGYLIQHNDSTVVGKRNFLTCYGKARQMAFSSKNIRSGWKATGLWPISIARPLMSPLLLENASKPSKPGYSTPMRASDGGKDENWASATSIVAWSTPKKTVDLYDQLSLFSKLDKDQQTQRLLFRKVQKGFDEKDYQLATAEKKIAMLEAEVEAGMVRKRRKVQMSPNSKFANIEAIHKAQIEASEIKDSSDESSEPELPIKTGDSITVAGDESDL
nr:transposase [Colletotrichum truncatum]KAF6783710.1 transposase [Colletotrichum truncatum]